VTKLKFHDETQGCPKGDSAGDPLARVGQIINQITEEHFAGFFLRPVTNLNLTDEETTDVQAEMAETLAFNVSVASDGLQGRSNPLHKWLDGGDEAGRRLRYVLWGPGGVGKSTLALKLVAAASGCGWCSAIGFVRVSLQSSKYPTPLK
jgi:hypothetical protein